MIRLLRDRGAIPANFIGNGRTTLVQELFDAAAQDRLVDEATKKKLFSSSRWKAAKAPLGRETYGKCAFCETPNAPAYYGDVEHFRPKAHYWWLAYCYDNYLYSCRICNGTKGEKHRLTGVALAGPMVQAGMSPQALLQLATSWSPDPTDAASVQAYEQACLTEIGALPNPYQENPEYLFEWKADPELKEVVVVAKGNGPRETAAYEAAIDIVGLNRPELRVQRWRAYRTARRFHDNCPAPDDPRRASFEEGMRELADDEMPFAGMMRFFLRQWGLLPPLP